MLDAGVAMEVSTAGLRKPAGELYPGPALLEMAVDAGLPLALSSDAHMPEQLGFRYEDAIAALRAAGVRGDLRLRAPRAPAGAARVSGPHRHRRRHARLRARSPAHPRRRRHPARAGPRRPLGRRRPHPRDHRRAARARPGWATSGSTSRTPIPRYEGADSMVLLALDRRAARAARLRDRARGQHGHAGAPEARPRTATRCATGLARAHGGRAGARERQGDHRRGHGLRRPRARASAAMAVATLPLRRPEQTARAPRRGPRGARRVRRRDASAASRPAAPGSRRVTEAQSSEGRSPHDGHHPEGSRPAVPRSGPDRQLRRQDRQHRGDLPRHATRASPSGRSSTRACSAASRPSSPSATPPRATAR